MVSVVGILAFTLIWIDRGYEEYITTNLPWLFGGTPDAARSLLATIAGSVITVISIAFSLTVLAIQQASVQFSPRVLRTFTSDRGNQIVLGAYLATFVYSLLVLRAIRTEDGGVGSFVPSISATVALLLVLVCIGLLIYFINHIATSLQASTIISRIHRELLHQIDSLYPEMIGEAADEPKSRQALPRGRKHTVKAEDSGFITFIHEDTLSELDLEKTTAVRILPKVGDFISYGQVIAEVYSAEHIPEDVQNSIRIAVAVNGQRTVTEDPLYAVRQLVDTALKGLSPGINDTTTSNYCIRYLGDAMGRLANRKFPSSVRTFDDVSYKLYLNKPTWEQFVHGAFVQIIHNAADSIQVLGVVLLSLQRLAEQLPNKERAKPVQDVVSLIASLQRSGKYLPEDKKVLAASISDVRRVLWAVPSAQ